MDGKPDAAAEMFKTGLKIYPLSQAASPPAIKIINGSGKPFNTIHANSYEFYEELHDVIEREPATMPDPELRGLFASIGIQKGKPFAPDARMKKILTEAAAIGNAAARATMFQPRTAGPFIRIVHGTTASSAAITSGCIRTREAATSTRVSTFSTRRRSTRRPW